MTLFKNTLLFSLTLLTLLSFPLMSNAQVNTCIPIGNSCEDAEEKDSGDVDLDDSDLDLGKYLSGLTFTDLGIPLNAFVTSATIQFTAKGNSSDATTQLLINGDRESADICFDDDSNNLSSRERTTNSSAWTIAEQWTANQTYTSPDISDIIQEIIEGPGYAPNDPITLLIEEDCNNHGKRSAYSFDGSASQAPVLCIEYYTDVYTLSGRVFTDCNGVEDQPVPNVILKMGGSHLGQFTTTTTTDENGYYEFQFQANRNAKVGLCKADVNTCGMERADIGIINSHVVNPGNTGLDSPYKLLAADIDGNQSIEFADANFAADFMDGPPGIQSFFEIGGQHWRFVRETFNFPFPDNPWATFFPGFEAYNGLPYADLPNQDFIAVKVGDVDCTYDAQCEIDNATSVCLKLDADCQDAEEYNGGGVSLTSNLDLGKWLIGLNFTGANIPSNAVIYEANIIFTATGDVDQNDDPCHVKFWGSADNLNCFTDDDENISSRSRTTERVDWNITEVWNQGQTYSSPDLSHIIQGIINTPGYGVNNPLNLMIAQGERNEGIREAYSFDKDPRAAPVLCIKYAIKDCVPPSLSPNPQGGGRTLALSESHNQNITSIQNGISNVKAYPNPFSEHLSIRFDLDETAIVTLELYNTLGQIIYNNTQEYSAGQHQLNMEQLPIKESSMLNYVLKSNDQQTNGKLIYIKN